MRNLRSSKQRVRLYLDFEGKCAICSEDLRRGWHADHKIPFCLIQKTEYANMQPLCPACNLKKGKKMPENIESTSKNHELLMDVSESNVEIEKQNWGKFVDINKSLRIGQRGAFNTLVKAVVLEERSTIPIVLPTRYGKSDVMRLAAIELYQRGCIAGSIFAAPCCFLRDQLVNKEKITCMMSRNEVNIPLGLKFDALDSFRLPLFPNREHFVAMTTQMFANNIDEICEWLSLEYKKTGKRYIVFIDECQTSSENNTWGIVVPKILEAGGIVALFTATPYREGNEILAGFEIKETKTKQIKRCRPSTHPDKDKIYINEYIDTEKQYSLVPAYEYPFRNAWDEGTICKLSRITFDCEIKATFANGKDFKKNISQISSTECRKYLGKIVRDHKVIRKGVELLLDRLDLFRKLKKEGQGIIFCGNDNHCDDNELTQEMQDKHAKDIEKIIRKLDKNLKVVIATSNDAKADDKIKSFCEDKICDILIVKNMASLGLDNHRLKIGLDLSAVRTRSAYVQRVMRVATRWDDCKVAYLITPADVLQDELWNSTIADEGGSITITESELIDTYEIDKNPETNAQTSFEVLKVLDSELSDSDKSEAIVLGGTFERKEFNGFIACFPELQKNFTDPDIANMFDRLRNYWTGSNSEPKANVISIKEEKKSKRKRIQFLVKDIAAKSGETREDFENKIRNIYFKAKKCAGINPKTKLKDIPRLEDLDKIIVVLENWTR
jgi:hypothetical protein